MRLDPLRGSFVRYGEQSREHTQHIVYIFEYYMYARGIDIVPSNAVERTTPARKIRIEIVHCQFAALIASQTCARNSPARVYCASPGAVAVPAQL